LGNTDGVEGDLETAERMFQQAISIWRNLGQGHWLAMALNNLGKVEIRRGELQSARSHLHEALRLAHRMGNRRRLAYTLSAIADVEAAEDHAECAATLDAVAVATIREIGAALPRSGRRTSSAESSATDLTLTLERAVE